MNFRKEARVLAIGVDAGEPTLIREMIERDELPALKSLLAEGKWLCVKSPAHIGSGSVWPTFITGEDPTKHGIYGEWAWHPETMGLSRYNGRGLQPFWNELTAEGVRVGVLDVPFAPFTGFAEGFELSEWGPHDLLEGRMQVAPGHIADLVMKEESHPLLHDRLDTGGPRDYEGVIRLSSGCLSGIRLRGGLARRLMAETKPNLSIIVFTEIHHSAHYLWHTLSGDHPVYQNDLFRDLRTCEPTLKDIYREIDTQIGKLVEVVGPKATVLVFSLHGMRPTHGVPSFILPLLCKLGYSRLADWTSQTWTERAIAMMGAVKRRTPNSLKKLYYRSLPATTTLRLARPTMLALYDWDHTRAFALPADQHGWIQVNLKGRETRGIVAPEEYEQTCNELEELLKGLAAADGKPIVREVIRTAGTVEEAVGRRLPDLVVHWEDAAFRSPLQIRDIGFTSEPLGKKFTGRHSRDGFCIFRPKSGLQAEHSSGLLNGHTNRLSEGESLTLHEGDTMAAKEIHRVIKACL